MKFGVNKVYWIFSEVFCGEQPCQCGVGIDVSETLSTPSSGADVMSVKSQSHVRTDGGQSVSPSWYQTQSGAHGQILVPVNTVAVLSLQGALSDERVGLSYQGHCQLYMLTVFTYLQVYYMVDFRCMYIQHIRGLSKSGLRK
jgi:hypothetical protein